MALLELLQFAGPIAHQARDRHVSMMHRILKNGEYGGAVDVAPKSPTEARLFWWSRTRPRRQNPNRAHMKGLISLLNGQEFRMEMGQDMAIHLAATTHPDGERYVLALECRADGSKRAPSHWQVRLPAMR